VDAVITEGALLGGGAPHIWRLFQTWAEKLAVEDFTALIERHATREPPRAP